MTKFEGVQKNMATNLEGQTRNYEKVAEAVDKQLAAIGDRAEKFETGIGEGYFEVITRGIENLNEVLKELNGKQIVVKKKWFGR